MARVFADDQGRILQVRRDVMGDDDPFAGSPPTHRWMVAIDESANADVVRALERVPDEWSLLNGTLTRNGQPVTLAESADFRDRENVRQAASQVDNAIQLLAGGGSLTNVQRDQAILILLRAVRYLMRWVARNERAT